MSTKITFLRHGATAHNSKGIYSGASDPPLDGDGVSMVERAAHKLCGEPYNALFYGQMRRVEQTAQIVLGALRQPPDMVRQCREIHEMDFGLFEGLTYAEIEAKYPVEWQQYMDCWQQFTFPQGSNIRSFFEDCGTFITGVLREHAGKNLLVVGHKGFILSCVATLQNEGLNGLFNRDIKHAKTLTLFID